VLAGKIARLTSIADYRLFPQDPQTIHDIYFDRQEGELQTKKLALRIREVGETHWIALKGPSQPTDVGVRRLEIEEPWSREALTSVIKELVDRRIEVPQPRDFDPEHPLDVVDNLGLEIIQDRQTHRQVRHIIFREEDRTRLLAELAIDSVVYHIDNQAVRHYEVEIEAKIRHEGPTVIKTTIESLVRMYGPALRRWKHSKLATGKAIERLLHEGALKGLLNTRNNLKPAAYDMIDSRIKQNLI